MNSKSLLEDEFVPIMNSLMAIHCAENDSFESLNTISGRELYLKIAVNLLSNKSDQASTIKSLLGSVTDRALRKSIRKFQSQGLIEVVESGQVDGRNRQVVPTEQLVEHIHHHLSNVEKALSRYYLLINKKLK